MNNNEYLFKRLKLEMDVSDSFILCLMSFYFWFATRNNIFAFLGFFFILFIMSAMSQASKLKKENE